MLNRLVFGLIIALLAVYSLNAEDDHDHDENENPTDTTTKKYPTNAEKYGYGTIAIVIVSGLALIGILLLPCFKKKMYSKVLQVLTALAVGTLFNDAILHMLPHIISNADDHDHSSKKIEVPDSLIKLVILVISLYFFWLFEILMHRLSGRKIEHHGHGHSHNLDMIPDEVKVEESLEVSVKESSSPVESDAMPEKVNEHSNSQTLLNKIKIGFKNYIKDFRVLKKVKISGWIILIGDALHNFADGLAVGASFSVSINLGISTTIAVVCHEVPHELGNYAVLMKCGFTHFQALFFNLLSATTCIIGFYIGVSISSGTTAATWIFAITAGMFIYIALVDLLPNIFGNKEWDWIMFFICNGAMILGFVIMFLLAIFEEHIAV